MNRDEAVTLAEDLLAEFGLSSWQVRFERKITRLGACRYVDRVILLSRPLVDVNERALIEDTIRHEIAHAMLPPEAAHGPQWEAQCAITGARPVAGYYRDEITMPPAPWVLRCQHGCESPRYRRPTSVWRCRRHGATMRGVQNAQ